MDELPASIDPPSTVLFLGSGFTRAAKNILGTNPVTGAGLTKALARLLGDPDTTDSLPLLAEDAMGRDDIDLYQFLYQMFTIHDLDPSQRVILQDYQWLRIYTTNYDDSVEFAHYERYRQFSSYNYDDPKPRRLPMNTVIHLHGNIRQLHHDAPLQALVLTESSHVRQHFERSPWYDEFVRDIRFSSACFFIGYSLSDYHITALLRGLSPAPSAKLFFIQLDLSNRREIQRLRQYGTVITGGLPEFVRLCRVLPCPAPIADPRSLKGFRYLDPHKDKKTLAPPTPLEVFNLLTFGTFNYVRALSPSPHMAYVIERRGAVDEARAALRSNRCLLLHSRIGNGKSVFLYLLAIALAEDPAGYRCFFFRGQNPVLQQELGFLAKLPNVVVFIDPYSDSQDSIVGLANALPNAKFVVTVRSGVHDVRLHEINQAIPKPFYRISLNSLTSDDVHAFAALCRNAGLSQPDVRLIIRNRHELRDILIKLFQNQFVLTRIRDSLNPVFVDQQARSVLLGILLIHWTGERAEPAFVHDINRVDAFTAIGHVREAVGDILHLGDDKLDLRSSIFAQYCLQHFFERLELHNMTCSVIKSAAARKHERRYRIIMSHFMQINNLRWLFRPREDTLVCVKAVFEDTRASDVIGEEPLFWLQYAMCMIEMNNLPATREFIGAAYERAEDTEFRTYQIDTQSFRLLLLLEMEAAGSVEHYDEIVKKLEMLCPLLGQESHSYYVIRVLKNIEPFIDRRGDCLAQGEKVVMVYWLNMLCTEMERLPAEVKTETGSDSVLRSIRRAVRRLTRDPSLTVPSAN